MIDLIKIQKKKNVVPTIITKRSILDVAAVLDQPLHPE